jgi:hypothetical protein
LRLSANPEYSCVARGIDAKAHTAEIVLIEETGSYGQDHNVAASVVAVVINCNDEKSERKTVDGDLIEANRGKLTEINAIIVYILLLRSLNVAIIIIIIIFCHRFSFFPGTSPLEPVVNPTTQASSLSL